MVKFTDIFPSGFNAALYNPGQKIRDMMEPRTYARLLWDQYETPESVDLNAALSLARFDRDVYDDLQQWAWSQDVDSFTIELQAALGRVLGRKRPDKRRAETVRRNSRYLTIANALVREYNIPLAQAVDGGPVLCAAAILETLPGAPSEGTIRGILSNAKK